jgi:hypothetical protein
MVKENNKMKSFAFKYLLVLVLIGFGFVGGALFVKRDHVPVDVFAECNEDFAKAATKAIEAEQKFMQCVIFLNGVLEGKGVKK